MSPKGTEVRIGEGKAPKSGSKGAKRKRKRAKTPTLVAKKQTCRDVAAWISQITSSCMEEMTKIAISELVLVRGVSGSGKTTLAQKLSELLKSAAE
jgi:signal recognition particle GTPase